MSAKRRFHRVSGNTGAVLQFDDTKCNCRLENISPSGALVSLKSSTGATIHRGDTLLLKLHQEHEDSTVVIRSRVAHIGFSLLGLAFLDPDAAATAYLEKIIARVSREPTAISG